MKLTAYDKALLKYISTKAMKKLNLPKIPVGFNDQAGIDNAYIGFDETGNDKNLVFSNYLSKSAHNYVDWYQLLAHELTHYRQAETKMLSVIGSRNNPCVKWNGVDMTDQWLKANESDDYYVLPWEQDANMRQEALGIYLKNELGINLDKQSLFQQIRIRLEMLMESLCR